MEKNQFASKITLALIFLIACIDMCFKYYGTGFTWLDVFVYLGLTIGLASNTADAIDEYKNRKK